MIFRKFGWPDRRIAVLSTLIRSLLLGSTLRIPPFQDLPKPFPRLCIHQSLIFTGGFPSDASFLSLGLFSVENFLIAFFS